MAEGMSSGVSRAVEKKVLAAARKGKMGTVDVQLRALYSDADRLVQFREWVAVAWKERMEAGDLDALLTRLDTKLEILGVVREEPTPTAEPESRTTAPAEKPQARAKEPSKKASVAAPTPAKPVVEAPAPTVTSTAPRPERVVATAEVADVSKEVRIKVLRAARKGKWGSVENQLLDIEDPAKLRGLDKFAVEHWEDQIGEEGVAQLRGRIATVLGLLGEEAVTIPQPKLKHKGPARGAEPKKAEAPKKSTPTAKPKPAPVKTPSPAAVAKKEEARAKARSEAKAKPKPVEKKPEQKPVAKPKPAPKPQRPVAPPPKPSPARRPKPKGPAPAARPRSRATSDRPRRRSAEGR